MRHRFAAELVGTFGIVFAPVALSASARFAGGDGSLASAAWVSGLAVSAMIAAFGPVSAAHFNPAVTIGFAVAGRFPWRRVPAYIAAQVLGACLAAGAVRVCFGVVGAGVHLPAPGVSPFQVIAIEAVLTFLLMLVVMAVATDKRTNPTVPPLVIGLLVVANVLIGGAITGGSMNPARSLAPALFADSLAPLAAWWQYAMGTILGAVVAARLYETVLRPVSAREHAQNAPADLLC
ncbi:MAG: aquaporin [Armatimonadetes bacterium]|nr:aquaporin [Armatimonadota bacterium]